MNETKKEFKKAYRVERFWNKIEDDLYRVSQATREILFAKRKELWTEWISFDIKIRNSAIEACNMAKRLDPYEDGRWIEKYMPDKEDEPEKFEKFLSFAHSITTQQFMSELPF